MFIGENLTNLRIMHGYSRKQLSEMLGVTEQSIWQYENGYTSPKMQTINDLKRIFNVKSKYFYTKNVLSQYKMPNNVDVSNIAYRSKILNSVSKTQAEAKHIEYLDAFVSYITEKVSLPTLKIVALRNMAIEYLNKTSDDRITQINKVAQMARNYLGMAPDTNDELMFVVEKSGVFIFEKAIGEEIDAYSLWTKNNRAYIILGNLKKSAVRRNFDIAHELGHLLLHYRIEFTHLNRREHKEIEHESDLFAEAFLLPKKEFTHGMKNVIRITNPDAYLDLKKKWKTSLQVLAYRAANLGIISPKDHRNFYASMHRKGYLKTEPLDKIIPLQRPKKIKTILDFALNNNLLDIYKMVENDWKADLNFFYDLTGIDPTFFKKYLNKSLDFGIKNVTEISKRSFR